MTLIIDIDEKDFHRICQEYISFSDTLEGRGLSSIAEGIPIPDNATNGDMIKMMFPYYSYERNDYVQSIEDYIVDCMECMEHDLYFAYDWWNAPYQKGGKE